MSERVMYVKPGCPYCQRARERLTAEGLDWEERDATTSPALREELYRHSSRGIVPTIVGPGGTTVGFEGGG